MLVKLLWDQNPEIPDFYQKSKIWLVRISGPDSSTSLIAVLLFSNWFAIFQVLYQPYNNNKNNNKNNILQNYNFILFLYIPLLCIKTYFNHTPMHYYTHSNNLHTIHTYTLLHAQ